MVLILPSCIEEGEEVPYTYKQICVTSYLGDDYLFTSDLGERLLAKSLPKDYEFEEDKRVVVAFSNYSDSQDGEYDYLIVPTEIINITTKDIIFINEENKDTLGNDGVIFNGIYANGDYLDLDFTFGASGTRAHYFNMSYDEALQTASNDTVKLTFHHKDNNDSWVQSYSGYLSFDLRSLGDKEPEKPYVLTLISTKATGAEFKTDIKVE